MNAPDQAWSGALRVVEYFDDVRYIKTLLENTAKQSSKGGSRGGVPFRPGRRR